MCNVTVIDHLHQCDIVFDIPVCFLSVYRLLPVYYSIGTNVYRHYTEGLSFGTRHAPRFSSAKKGEKNDRNVFMSITFICRLFFKKSSLYVIKFTHKPFFGKEFNFV